MIRITDKRDCIGCGNCVQVCPQQCIRMTRDAEGFSYPKADGHRCIDCGKCHAVCPVEAGPGIAEDRRKPLALGACHKDTGLRMKSSSGGVFAALAADMLERGGTVYGAAAGPDGVRHRAVRTPEALPSLQGSKYVQSDILGLFPAIREQLEAGEPVLFSGTPCQVKALYAFLAARPDRLLTVEVICHGVPSPGLYERYLQEEKAVSMTFREKSHGWQDYDVLLTGADGRTRRQRAALNLYMRGFLQNWTLRPSCSRCPAKSFASGADITLGDFWGGGDLAPGLFDDKGTSLVLLHTKSAEQAWERVSPSFRSALVPPEEAVKGNPGIFRSAVLPDNRDDFFAAANRQSVKAALRRYAGEKPGAALKRRLLTVWNRLWETALHLRNKLLAGADGLYARFHRPPRVVGIEDTLRLIIEKGCSASRFGDGELKLLCGEQTWFQDADPLLQKRLQEILAGKGPERLLACVPGIFESLSPFAEPDRQYWRQHLSRHRKTWYRYMDRRRTYYDAFISRCYLPFRDKGQAARCFGLWKRLWEDRDILVIEGEKTRLGVGNDLFAGARSVRRILCPNTQAFARRDALMEATLRQDRRLLVLLALGPSATVLAADLCAHGFQAVDTGHLDIEYEWFLRGAEGKIPVPGKFVGEAGAGAGVGTCEDGQYLSEILCRC